MYLVELEKDKLKKLSRKKKKTREDPKNQKERIICGSQVK